MSNDKFFYNPKVQYYFLSVQSVGSTPAWIRRPFLTKEELDEFFFGEYLLNPSAYKNLEIFNETLLREKIHVPNQQGVLVEVDIRSWLFDDRYSSQSEHYKSQLSGNTGFGYKRGFSDFVKNQISENTCLWQHPNNGL